MGKFRYDDKSKNKTNFHYRTIQSNSCLFTEKKKLQNKQSYSKQIKINGWCRKIYIEAFLGSWRKQKQTCIQMIYFHFSFSMNNSCLFRNKSADISMKETLSQNACNSSLCMYLLKTRASFSIIETVSKVLISQTCHIDKVSWVGLFLGIHRVCNVSDSLREFHSIYEDNHQFIRKNCLDASCLSRLFFHCKFIHTYVKMSQFIAIVVRRNEKKFHFPISCGCGKKLLFNTIGSHRSRMESQSTYTNAFGLFDFPFNLFEIGLKGINSIVVNKKHQWLHVKIFVVFAINWISTIRRNTNMVVYTRVYINVDKDI